MEIPFGTYNRRFQLGGQHVETHIKATSRRLRTALIIDGQTLDTDETPSGETRNHSLSAPLADGRILEVEAGYVGWTSAGIVARIDGGIVHESHPGKTVAFPKSAARLAALTPDKKTQRASRVPIAIDIAFGLIFYIVASLTDLTTAALVGACLGISLLIVQRFVSVDIVGGLALFGTVMLAISAGFALVFDSGIMVQLRTSIVGVITGLLFGLDGLVNRGRWLGRGMARYIPFNGIDLKRLALGMAILSVVIAALNVVVVLLASEGFWLIYTTFLDIPLVVVGAWIVIYKSFAPQTPDI